MTTLKEQISRVADEELYQGGHDGKVKIKEMSKKPHFKASTHQKKKDIRLSYNPEYEQNNPGRTEVIAGDIMKHEINHHKYRGFKGCPRNVENHVELVFEPMCRVLLPKYTIKDVCYIANALEDTILHKDLSRDFSLEGISEFLEDVGKSNEGKFTDYYESHVKLNMFLWGNKQQKKAMRRFYKHSENVRTAIQNFLKRTGLSDMRDEEFKDSSRMRAYLNDEENWQSISKIYAEEFSKLMEPGYALPLLNHSGEGTKKESSGNSREDEDEDEQGEPTDSEESEESEEGNVFDEEMKSREYKRGRIQRASENGERKPSWMTNFEAMDLLYEGLARKLNINAQTFSQQCEMPVYWYGKRELNQKRDDLKHTTFGLDDSGALRIKKRMYSEDIPIAVKEKTQGFPEARWGIIDTSSSMKSDPQGGENVGNIKIVPWGDNSRYHYAVLSFYGFIEFLKENGLLDQRNIGSVNFGDETKTAEGLTEAKRNILSPQFGNTTLNMNKINHLFGGRGKLVFTVSDGGISNWSRIRDNFIESAKKHAYFHLQIGEENETSMDLKNNGLYVEYMTSAEDLARKTINLSDKLFRGGLEERTQ